MSGNNIALVDISELTFSSTQNDAYSKAMNKLQKKANVANSQYKYNNFLDMAQDYKVEKVMNYADNLSKASSFKSQNEHALIRANSCHDVLGQIIELAGTFQQNLIKRMGPSGNPSNFALIINNNLAELQNLMNSHSDGRYLFSGSASNIPPITNIINQSNLDANSNPTDLYYQGSDVVDTVDVTSSFSVQMGVAANNQAFQNLIGSINLANRANINSSTSDFTNAVTLLGQSVDQLINLRAIVGNNIKTVEEVNKQYLVQISASNEQIVGDTIQDVASASIDFEAKRTQMQALFRTRVKLEELKLELPRMIG